MKLESYEEGIELLMNPAMERLINVPDLEGNTPLHLAVKNSDHIKAKVILDMDKTGINLRNKNGDTPWDLTKRQQELSENMVSSYMPISTFIYFRVRNDTLQLASLHNSFQ